MTKEDILDKEGFDFSAFEFENEYSAKAILNAMSEHARQEAIAFKEWQDSNLEEYKWEQYDTPDRWINTRNMRLISTEQLYELYLSQK